MQTVIYVISTTFLPLKRRRLSRETSPAARSEQRRLHKQCDIFTFRYISSVLNHTQGSGQICEQRFTYYDQPLAGKTLVIREPYQSPEHAFDSFLKDDLPDQNKNVEKCKQQSKDFKSSSSLWKKDSTLSFVYIALSLSLSTRVTWF